MASPTQWTWLWVNSRSWRWTGRPGVLRFMGSQRVGHDWATELNWSIIALQCCVGFCCTRSESATHTHTHTHHIYSLPLELSSHPTPCLTHLGHYRAPTWALCALQQVPTSSLFYTWVYMSIFLSQFVLPSPPPTPCPHTYSLHLHLYSSLGNRFLCTIFLDSMHLH